MSNDVNNLILEHLRAIRSDVGEVKRSVGNLTERVSSLEDHVSGIHRELALIHTDIAGLRHSQDHTNDRLTRVETRLGLVEA